MTTTDTISANPGAATMHLELAALLDAVPSSRHVLQHLAVVEQALKQRGRRGLESLPDVVLEKARTQLISLPLQPHHEALAQLLAHLLAPHSLGVAIPAAAVGRDTTGHTDQYLSSFLTEDKLVVSDATHTDFQRVFDESGSAQR